MTARAEGVSTAVSQRLWGDLAVGDRLRVLRAGRLLLAKRAAELVDAIAGLGLEDCAHDHRDGTAVIMGHMEGARNRADSYAAEVLPLLEACRFLERSAAGVLRTRVLGRGGLPFWLAGVESRVERVPFGRVLVIGPANYPLLLAGVQTLQALAAGNAVVWKPGAGGARVAVLVAEILSEAGLPDGLLRVAGESVASGIAEVEAGSDKIVFTGSAAAGKAVLRMAAETVTPVVAELSGCDAVFCLPSADAPLVVRAMEFGMRLNGSATCMAPRRLVLVGPGHEGLVADLRKAFRGMREIAVDGRTEALVAELVGDAAARGGKVTGTVAGGLTTPVLIEDGDAAMLAAKTDVFAPVLTVLRAGSLDEAVQVHEACGMGLTAAVFGEERAALQLGSRLRVGTLLVNDLIVPTVDPRVPFGGRGASGFGTTRGAEGLLEMTAARTVLVRRKNDGRHFSETGRDHEEMFRGVIAMTHGGTWGERLAGLRGMVGAARRIGMKDKGKGEKQIPAG